MIAAVLSPEDLAALDQATPVFVPFDVTGNPQEWFGRARERLRDMHRAQMTTDRYTAFRKANLGPMMRLQTEYNSYWRQLDRLITEGERP
jgi:hypothetical protein